MVFVYLRVLLQESRSSLYWILAEKEEKTFETRASPLKSNFVFLNKFEQSMIDLSEIEPSNKVMTFSFPFIRSPNELAIQKEETQR